MESARRSAVVAGLGVCALSGASLICSAPASASTVLRTAPAITITIQVADMFRVDRQDDQPPAAVFAGVDAKSKVRVNWGDGEATEHAKGRCGAKGAAAYPDACAVTFDHYYSEPGTYTITAATGRRVATKQVTVVPAPVAWRAPDGWVQPAGWSVIGWGAPFTPCSTVRWYVDRAGEPADRATTRDDVAAGLAVLATQTGLTFVETTDPEQATMTYKWADWGPDEASGRGGPTGMGRGEVTLNSADEWTKNDWAGLNMVTKQWSEGGMLWTWVMPGRGWLIVHETMHALGMGHVEDATQVMNPIASAAALGAGDLEGLHTMYLNMPCSPIPD
jgi:hypothetical protein